MKQMFFLYIKRLSLHIMLAIFPWFFLNKSERIYDEETELIVHAGESTAKEYVDNPGFYKKFPKDNQYSVYRVKPYSYTRSYLPFTENNVKYGKPFYRVME